MEVFNVLEIVCPGVPGQVNCTSGALAPPDMSSMSNDPVNCESGVALSDESANGRADDVLAKRAKKLAAKLADKEGLAAEMAKIEERKAKLKQYTKEYNDKKKLLLQELCAEADECAAKGLAMDSGRAAELAMMLEKKEKARQATKAWKKENVQQEKVVQQLYYQIHKPEILESRNLQNMGAPRAPLPPPPPPLRPAPPPG